MSVRLYAVLRLRPRAGRSLPPGLQGERLTILTCAGCSVAVADSRGVPLDLSVDHLLEFDRVIRALSELSDAILPARFGTVAQSAATLKAEIAERAGEFGMALDSVAGRVQMTLRIPPDPRGAAGPEGLATFPDPAKGPRISERAQPSLVLLR